MVSFSKVFLAGCGVVALLCESVFGGNIACLDSQSCKDETITGDTNIYCYGYYACDGADITVDNVAHCNGYYGCASATLSGGTQVRCSGSYACYGADVTLAADILYVYGVEGASSATLSNSEKLEAHGFYALRGATVKNVDYILAAGAYALAYSDIDSDNVENLKVYSEGLHAGYEMTIYCRDGTTCYLDCGTNYGCSTTTEMYCYDTANCEYDCDSTCSTSACPTEYDESSQELMTLIHENLGLDTFDEFVKMVQEERAITKKYIEAKRSDFILSNDKIDDNQEMEDVSEEFYTWAQTYSSDQIQKRQEKLFGKKYFDGKKSDMASLGKSGDSTSLIPSNGKDILEMILPFVAGIIVTGLMIICYNKAMKAKQYSYARL